MTNASLAPTRRLRRAAVHLDSRHALAATTTPDGEIVAEEFVADPLLDDAALAHEVVRWLGPQDRLFVSGDPDQRTELERTYVGVHHRPECLIDIDNEGKTTIRALVEQLCRMER